MDVESEQNPDLSLCQNNQDSVFIKGWDRICVFFFMVGSGFGEFHLGSGTAVPRRGTWESAWKACADA